MKKSKHTGIMYILIDGKEIHPRERYKIGKHIAKFARKNKISIEKSLSKGHNKYRKGYLRAYFKKFFNVEIEFITYEIQKEKNMWWLDDDLNSHVLKK